MKPPVAGVTAVYAVPEMKSSTCTTVLTILLLPGENNEPIANGDCFVFDRIDEAALSPVTISTVSSRSEWIAMRGVNVGNAISST